MEVAEGSPCHQRASIDAHASDGLCYPGRIPGEEGIILRCAGEFDKAQLHDEVVDILLCLLLCDKASVQISLDIDVQKGGSTAKTHSGAILLLDSCQIAEVEPLDGLLCVLCRLADVKSVDVSQFFQLAQGPDLLGQLFPQADVVAGHADQGGGELLLFVLNEPVCSIQGYPAVVADDAASAVGVRKTGDDG